jgi:hypothetical protein
MAHADDLYTCCSINCYPVCIQSYFQEVYKNERANSRVGAILPEICSYMCLQFRILLGALIKILPGIYCSAQLGIVCIRTPCSYIFRGDQAIFHKNSHFNFFSGQILLQIKMACGVCWFKNGGMILDVHLHVIGVKCALIYDGGVWWTISFLGPPVTLPGSRQVGCESSSQHIVPPLTHTISFGINMSHNWLLCIIDRSKIRSSYLLPPTDMCQPSKNCIFYKVPMAYCLLGCGCDFLNLDSIYPHLQLMRPI